ncbi:uncharacterized protein VDAG_09319 [Verticillium dahliae VdLs.17]|uniref:Uncharacterized protein n=1 Tax=Verticillium dahliae (strain VdLs.17 / ATCC MYA-4575 / FGSC 10137) TaxID=498257 RepID=G2XGN7_VERDV|nr:uncharacterized protein VDAG_09319 [Verticillium dahliae VdLs.17]EGY18985.1 hypothetical protein VDAG_09319 [Verticillium dahliae VdLs.17]KAH6692997.1 hypothetical protein EV126DRAFT_444651 [Verticillium dahliae]
MLFNNFVAAAFLAFASVGMTSPVPITGDISVGDTNPLIAARQRVVPKPSGPVPGAPNKGSAATAILGIAEKINLLIQQTIDKDLEVSDDGQVQRQAGNDCDVVVLGAGASFTRQGDDGFENWAYSIPGSCRANRQTISC